MMYNSPLTTEEAMVVLKATRRELIDAGLALAIDLCKRNGSTHTREVYTRMKAEGYPVDAVKGFWVSVIFRRKLFEWTGDWYCPNLSEYDSDTSTWSEDVRPVRVWRLRD